MFDAPKLIPAINHPMIREAYVKKDYSLGAEPHEILVIDAILKSDNQQDVDMMDLLIDLPDIEMQAEELAGHIDRVDIITH